ncbi:uncharacterized protein MELLADRAFT_115612 [Melampsora larici-populina 98AG31]|uniref:Uncharacterized protein n=1 Tax=Melampsora larici-populina (strain 98AG31 / pathotype 3-4-7) TaxID=747676 RepID=F4RCQ5_MELLP|nr:uncharacterized protein MELLADRAFT_115612 [Melampsora larici-populina 98AG31]EGG09674.1 hypothetical protein MELLADRAFT_115612 [Melampsora larici-populina 98AG31]
MKYLLSSKHKSKGSQQSIEHEVKSPLPVLELSFNDNFRIMPDLSRRFTLLRNNAGGFLPIGTVQQHLEYQRERGQLTRSEENLILQELTKHTTTYEEEPSDSHTAVSKSTDHLPPSASPIKTSSGSRPFFGSSSERDIAYLQKEFKTSSASKEKFIRGVTRLPKEPIISEEPGFSDYPSIEPTSTSVTQQPEEQSTNHTSEDDDEEELVLSPVRLQRISMALDRILGDHLASPISAPNMRPTSSSTSEYICSGSASGQSNESPRNLTHSPSIYLEQNAHGSNSAESRVHDELLKALSTTPTSASASPSLMTTDSSLRCSDDFRPDPTSSIDSDPVYSCASSRERQSSQSSLTSTRSSTAISSCFHGSYDEHERNTLMCFDFTTFGEGAQAKDLKTSLDAGIFPDAVLSCESINRDQLFTDSNIRYSDLIAIQETLVASAPASSTNVSSRIPCANEPSLPPKNSLGRSKSQSTASRGSPRIASHSTNIARPTRSSSFRKQVSTTKLSRGIGSCHRMRSASQSAESSSPSSDPFIRVSSVSSSSSMRHRSNGVPPLVSSSVSPALTPESHSFPITPVLSQESDPNPRHQNLLVYDSFSSNDVDKHLGIHQVCPLPDVKEEAQPLVTDPTYPSVDDVDADPPMKSEAEDAVPTVVWPKRAQPGRANRPVPTTLLFRDVEAQAVAANAALRCAATLPRELPGSDGTVKKESGPKLKKDIKKKKSISRAQIGAPQLVSASANLASLELDQAALVLRANAQANSPETDDRKRGSTRASFKLRLRKKKPSDGVSTPLEDPSGHSTVQAQVSTGWPSITSEYDHNASATASPAIPTTLSPNISSPQRPSSRDIDEVHGVERFSKTQSNSLGHSDGTLKQSLRRLLTSRAQSKPATPSLPALPRVPSLQGIDLGSRHPIWEGATAEVKQESQDIAKDPFGSDWVDVRSEAIEAVAPLKIMKVPGSIRDNTKGGKLRARWTNDSSEHMTADSSQAEGTLKPPQVLGGSVSEKRPSTDSVQRLLSDLGLPLQQGADLGVTKERAGSILETTLDGEERWVYHSAAAKGKGRAILDHEAPFDRSCSAGDNSSLFPQTQDSEIFTRSISKPSKQSAFVDDSPAQDTLPPNAVPCNPSNPARLHASFPILPQDLDGVGVADPSNLMVTAQNHDDTRSDYAASIFDLYDRPESSIWEQPSETNSLSHGEKMNRRSCAAPTKSKALDQSFLDITGCPSDQGHCRSSMASSSSSGSDNGAIGVSEGRSDDDVMMIMNKFRKDVTSNRASTASGLFPAIPGPYRSRKPSKVNVVHDGGRRKTVVEDEEDEQRVWKLILGGD